MTKNKIALAGICAALALPAIGLAGNAGDGSDYGTQPGFERLPGTHRAQDTGRSRVGQGLQLCRRRGWSADRVQQLRPVR